MSSLFLNNSKIASATWASSFLGNNLNILSVQYKTYKSTNSESLSFAVSWICSSKE